ncbi:hypothetical protein AAMO2058_000332600 [Amorphochlora amoebiformis]
MLGYVGFVCWLCWLCMLAMYVGYVAMLGMYVGYVGYVGMWVCGYVGVCWVFVKLQHCMIRANRIDFDSSEQHSDKRVDGALASLETVIGKMFGVLIAKDAKGNTHVLKGFSGQICGVWNIEGWVPPVCAITHESDTYKDERGHIQALNANILDKKQKLKHILELNSKSKCSADKCLHQEKQLNLLRSEIATLRTQQKEMSRRLLGLMQESGVVQNFRGQQANLPEIWNAAMQDTWSKSSGSHASSFYDPTGLSPRSSLRSSPRSSSRSSSRASPRASSRAFPPSRCSPASPPTSPSFPSMPSSESSPSMPTSESSPSMPSSESSPASLPPSLDTSAHGDTTRAGKTPLASRVRKPKVPGMPSGFGECCAPKLLNQAARLGLKPLALAEMWWGKAPPGLGRESGVFYSACQDKCEKLLGFCLCGAQVGAKAQPIEPGSQSWTG